MLAPIHVGVAKADSTLRADNYMRVCTCILGPIAEALVKHEPVSGEIEDRERHVCRSAPFEPLCEGEITAVRRAGDCFDAIESAEERRDYAMDQGFRPLRRIDFVQSALARCQRDVCFKDIKRLAHRVIEGCTRISV